MKAFNRHIITTGARPRASGRRIPRICAQPSFVALAACAAHATPADLPSRGLVLAPAGWTDELDPGVSFQMFWSNSRSRFRSYGVVLPGGGTIAVTFHTSSETMRFSGGQPFSWGMRIR